MQQPTPELPDQVAVFTRQFPNLFTSEVGCFRPEEVTELPFISEPDTSQLKHPVFSSRMRTMVEKQLKDWLDQGVVHEVDYTPRAITPMLLVPKPRSADFRLCLDFRLVNSCCAQVFSPPLDRHALIADLPSKKIFSSVDVSSAFTCVRLAEPLQTYFGIQFDGRYYVFRRLPFGFHNSMHLFLRAIRHTLAKVRPQLPADSIVAAYVDDICIVSDTPQSHRRSLELLFSARQEDGWTVKPSKCKLFQSELLFLGIRYSASGIHPDPALLAKLDDLRLPTSAADLRTVFGLSLCLQRFNYRMGHTLAPLRQYIRSSPAAFSTDEFRRIWTSCLAHLRRDVWSSIPLDQLSSEPMTVYLDSSATAHGAALFQGQHLVTMWSAFNARPHASSAESEITGLSRALQAFKPYLLGVPFEVLTDNRAVLSALTPTDQSDVMKSHLDVIQYWFGSRCTIRHLPGAANQLADLLSRSAYLSQRSGSAGSPVSAAVTAGVSRAEIQRRLESAHFGHWSYLTTLRNAQLEHGRWPGMERDVREFVDRCSSCAFSASPQTRDLPGVTVARQMGDRVSMDFAGPYFDASHMLVIVDDATKFVHTVHTPSTATRHAIQALEHWIRRFGPIRELVVDNASQWHSDSFHHWLARHRVSVRWTPSYYHNGNGLAERMIQTIQERMRRMLNGSYQDWPGVIAAATDAVNTSWSSAIQTTPQTLALGLDRQGVLLPELQIRKAWQRAQETMRDNKVYERHRFEWKHRRRSRGFQIGDRVLLQDPLFRSRMLQKLSPLWTGPFVIRRRNSNSTWLIQRRSEAPVMAHSSQIRLFVS